jgi:hypothetical protein
MKFFSKTMMAAVAAAAFATPAFAGPVGVSRTYTTSTYTTTTQTDPALIAKLQGAAQKALQDGRNGNKNNVAFGQKNYEIKQVIAQLENGQPVEQARIDDALEPVHVW